MLILPAVLIMGSTLESGFERTSDRTHGWGLRGKKYMANEAVTSALAPVSYQLSEVMTYWLQNHLFEELGVGSTILPRKDGQCNLSQDRLDQTAHRGSWTLPSFLASILT